MPWVHGDGVELRTESGQPHSGAFRVSVCCFRALYTLRASPQKLAELCTVLDMAETPLWWVALVGRLWVRSLSSEGKPGPGWSLRGCSWPRARDCLLAAAEMGSARPGLCQQMTGRALGARGHHDRAGKRMNLARSRRVSWERLLSPFSGRPNDVRRPRRSR